MAENIFGRAFVFFFFAFSLYDSSSTSILHVFIFSLKNSYLVVYFLED